MARTGYNFWRHAYPFSSKNPFLNYRYSESGLWKSAVLSHLLRRATPLVTTKLWPTAPSRSAPVVSWTNLDTIHRCPLKSTSSWRRRTLCQLRTLNSTAKRPAQHSRKTNLSCEAGHQGGGHYDSGSPAHTTTRLPGGSIAQKTSGFLFRKPFSLQKKCSKCSISLIRLWLCPCSQLGACP